MKSLVQGCLAVLVVLTGCASSAAPDAAADSSSPTLVLATGQPASCPATFPNNGDACTTAATCSYDYPPGYHPSGCSASCAAGDGGALAWNVPGCI